MKTLEFSIQLSTTPTILWNCLWEAANYTRWTSMFCEGSYYKTDSFTEGSKIHLLSPSGDGMYSILDKVEPYRSLTFRHLGELKNFKEQTEDQTWTNATESYTLQANNEGVELIVKVDTLEQYVEYMNNTFPLALQVLKQMAENQALNKSFS